MTKNIMTAWQRLMGLLRLDKRDVFQVFYYAIFAGVVNLSLPMGIQAIINLIQGPQIELKNKVLAVYRELESFESQNALIKDIVGNYNTLLEAEERKFSFGESFLFLVNSRESKLIDAELKQIGLQNKYYTTKAKLFNSLAVNPESL